MDVSSAGRGFGVHSGTGFSLLMLYLRVFEPVHSETFTQRHARTMKHHPQVAVRDHERRANLLALDFVHLAHHEHRGDALRQLAQAIAHRFPKFVPMHYFVGFRFPFLWAFHLHSLTLMYYFLRVFFVDKFPVGERVLASTYFVLFDD